MISVKTFNNLKKIKPMLEEEIKYDGRHHIDIRHDDDFMTPYDIDIDWYDIPNTFNNLDIRTAVNLDINVTTNPNTDLNVIHLQYKDSNRPLNVTNVLNIVKHLIKLGRTGINQRIKQNQNTLKKIQKLNISMRLE